MRALIGFVIVALLWVPVASAHIGHAPETHRFQMGDADLVIAPTRAPIIENRSTTFVLVNVLAENGSDPPPLTLRLTGPHGFDEERTFFENNSLRETGPVMFPGIGTYVGTLRPQDDPTSEEHTFDINVYGDFPFYFTPIDALEDPVAGKHFRLVFRVLDAQTEEPFDGITDLRLIREPWNAKHAANAEDLELRQYRHLLEFQPEGEGTWALNTTFEIDGPWRLELLSESGDFLAHESPPWQIDVLPAADTKDTSSVGPTAAIGAVVLAVALALRRR